MWLPLTVSVLGPNHPRAWISSFAGHSCPPLARESKLDRKITINLRSNLYLHWSTVFLCFQVSVQLLLIVSALGPSHLPRLKFFFAGHCCHLQATENIRESNVSEKWRGKNSFGDENQSHFLTMNGCFTLLEGFQGTHSSVVTAGLKKYSFSEKKKKWFPDRGKILTINDYLQFREGTFLSSARILCHFGMLEAVNRIGLQLTDIWNMVDWCSCWNERTDFVCTTTQNKYLEKDHKLRLKTESSQKETLMISWNQGCHRLVSRDLFRRQKRKIKKKNVFFLVGTSGQKYEREKGQPEGWG